MRKFLAGVVLLLAFAGGGVLGYQLVMQNMPDAAKYDWPFLDVWQYEQKQPIYIFLGNSFMGKYEDGEWYSISALSDYGEERTIFYLKDFVVVPAFQAYSMEQAFGDITMIGWDIRWEEGLGCFGSDSDTEYTAEQYKAMLELTGKTAAECENGDEIGYVKLPNQIKDKNLRKLSIPFYNARSYFGGYQYGDEEFKGEALVVNAEHDPRPERIKQGGELPEDYRRYFAELFKQEGMGDVPLVVTDYYQFDADNDGRDESVIILQNTTTPVEHSEGHKTHYGLYSYAFYADGERIQTIYKKKLLCSGREAANQTFDVTLLEYLSPIGVYDLDGDGKLEWCMDIGGWEWGSLAVYTLDDESKYRQVLCSRYGM